MALRIDNKIISSIQFFFVNAINEGDLNENLKLLIWVIDRYIFKSLICKVFYSFMAYFIFSFNYYIKALFLQS